MLVRTTLFMAMQCIALSLFAQSNDSLTQSLAIVHEQNHFDQQFSHGWYATSLQYTRRINKHVIIGKLNHVNRFQRNGLQYEAEAYPNLGGGWYAYTGIAYSNDVPVYPQWRTGVSLFAPMAQGWEGEGGFRMLRFDNSIWLGVAGLSKYAGSWLLNLRSFFSANTPTQDASVFFTARKYFHQEKNYWWLQLGRGISPDESRSVQFNGESKLTSNRISSGIKLRASEKLLWQLAAGWSADNYAPGKKGNQYFGNTGIEWLFR